MITLPSPDYEAPDVLVVQEPEQLRALGDDLRTRIVVLLREHARSITELAESLEPAEGNRRPSRQGAREGGPRPGRADAAGARADRAVLRAHRAPLPLQEHRRCRRRRRPERRGGLPPDRSRGDAPSRRRRPDDLRRPAHAPDRRRRAPLRAPAREARARLQGRERSQRASRTALVATLFRRAPDA